MNIFISYRRADLMDFVQRMHDHLESKDDIKEVFLDVQDLAPGEKFPEFIQSQLDACDVLLVMIGEKWERLFIERTASGEYDYVQAEIETALKASDVRRLVIMPVLVDNTPMPSAQSLPKSIHPILKLQAAKMRRDPHFKADLDLLRQKIHESLKGVRPEKFTLPLLEWVYVPAGETILRRDEETKTKRLPRTLRAFEISKYPVTVAQYASFIDDGGYEDARWGLQGRKPSDLPEFSKPDHPRVKVDLAEAMAFCRWLSSKTGREVRLPEEAEWQLAAHGEHVNRSYVWGDLWNPKYCNCSKSYRGTTSVNYFEKVGTSAVGVVDLAGNVYEWTTSSFKAPWAEEDVKPVYATKGGCWFFGYGKAFQIRDRAMRLATNSTDELGFRCVRELE